MLEDICLEIGINCADSHGALGVSAWMRQLVKDGAIGVEQAAAFTAQAETIYA